MLLRGSRREFLASAATVAAATAMAVEPGPVLAYAGTYSAPVGAEGAPGRGQGIYLFEMNLATGALVERAVFPNPDNPSCLALNTYGKRLYAANETATYKGVPSGSVSAYERALGLAQSEPARGFLAGGADYQNLSGPTAIDARYLWQSSEGEIIIVRNTTSAAGGLVPTFESRIDGPFAYLNTGLYLSSNPGIAHGGVRIAMYESSK